MKKIPDPDETHARQEAFVGGVEAWAVLVSIVDAPLEKELWRMEKMRPLRRGRR